MIINLCLMTNELISVSKCIPPTLHYIGQCHIMVIHVFIYIFYNQQLTQKLWNGEKVDIKKLDFLTLY